ncbi:hypothetical protein ACFQO4_07450 [Saliphagus sp. GCM10025334]
MNDDLSYRVTFATVLDGGLADGESQPAVGSDRTDGSDGSDGKEGAP